MFFRRSKAHQDTFSEYLTRARQAGFSVETEGSRARISRDGVAAVLEDVPGAHPKFSGAAGRLLDGEIAILVDAGFQKFLQTPSGHKRPALASDLREIHRFQEDLREAVDIPNIYNESLGTVSNQYIYDRVEDRDRAEQKAAWKKETTL